MRRLLRGKQESNGTQNRRIFKKGGFSEEHFFENVLFELYGPSLTHPHILRKNFMVEGAANRKFSELVVLVPYGHKSQSCGIPRMR
jgi:hypothetical protein